ncbi:protein kinase domain-containing protein [Paraliomyxa miuraensis]|uniref:protein kinase domain-containing protein n=1 Tax=Paraliomyxa miuraensis TaxID=376150 RepID=UPI00224D1A42|nr:protein kinase [Paraliomyxa miuraensis]MCX4246689.1 protein kinase [Paraliomyxa miuraensis]
MIMGGVVERGGGLRLEDSCESATTSHEDPGPLDQVRPALGGVVDAAEQARVFEALFEVPAERPWLGRYEVLGIVGRGGMGVVLEAFDRTLNRRIALKVLLPELDTQRLLREAQALAKLSHPNVVQVYEAGVVEDQAFIAMELVEGQSLREWLREEPRPSWRDCVEVFLQVGEGLAAAHAAGLVHRDFKPDNAIIDDHGRVRVLDFGLARQLDGPAESITEQRSAPRFEPELEPTVLEASLTRSGTVLGTLEYMPLEQLDGREADARSDQFSFCVALFEALHGERPFEDGSRQERVTALQEGRMRPPPPGNRVPNAVRDVVLRGLAASPDERWPSMDALLARLRRLTSPRSGWRWLTSMGLAGTMAAGVALWPRMGPCDALHDAGFAAWDEPARAAVEQGLLAVELPFAPKVWEQTRQALDRYAATWSDARLQACEAAHVDHTIGLQTYELRLACLDRRQERASALVQQLVTANAPTLARAIQAVQALPPIEPCNDGEGLRRIEDEVPEHLDQTSAEARRLVSEAWALHQAGRSREGAERAEQAIEHARPLGEVSVALGEAYLVRGQIHQEARRLPATRRDYHAALELAERTRDTELQLDVLHGLVLLAGREQDRSTAEAWMVQARGKLSHASNEPSRRIALRHAEGYVAYWASEHAAALERLEPVEAYYREHAALEPQLAKVLGVVGAARTALGELDAALEAHQEQLELAEGAGDYLTVTSAHHELAIVHVARGDLDTAEEHFGLALALFASIFGPGAPAAVQSRIGLIQVHAYRGELELALEHARLAREALASNPEAELDLRGQVMLTSGALAMARGQHEDALSYNEQARETFAAMPEPDPVALAMVDSNLGDCHRHLAHHDAARGSYERALVTLREHVDDDSPYWIRPLLGLGSLHQDQGAHLQALEPLERALGLLGGAQAEPELGASVRWHLGRALVEADRDRLRGLELVQQGRREFELLARADAVTEIDAWLTACGESCQPAPR